MTSPPMSETGSSPEAVALEIVDKLEDFIAEPGDSELYWNRATAERIVTEHIALLVANVARKAHLQDARAGCYFCKVFGDPHKSEGGLPGWWHQSPLRDDTERDGFECQRPEVWDALSLLPGGIL